MLCNFPVERWSQTKAYLSYFLPKCRNC